jgi:hypothetical protein
LEMPADGTPPLVAAPRHLRRRRLHEEIPDSLLVPGAELFSAPGVPDSRSSRGKPARTPRKRSGNPYEDRRKRTVALAAVLAVALTVPALILALILFG